MKEAFGRLLSSMKFWTTVIGMLLTAGSSLLAKYGFEVDDAAVQQIAITVSSFFGILLLGQAAADHGKEAAKTNATSNQFMQATGVSLNEKPSIGAIAPHPDGVTVALTDGSTHVVTKDKLNAVGFIAKVGLLLIVMLAFAGCSGTSKADVAHAGAASVINCAAPEVMTVRKQLGSLADYALVRSVGGDGSLDKDGLKSAFKTAGVQFGGCLLSDAFRRLANAASNAINGVQSSSVKVDEETAKQTLSDLYPGVTFQE